MVAAHLDVMNGTILDPKCDMSSISFGLSQREPGRNVLIVVALLAIALLVDLSFVFSRRSPKEQLAQ